MIPEHILDMTFDAVDAVFGTDVVFHKEGSIHVVRGILDQNPLEIDSEYGNKVISNTVMLTLKYKTFKECGFTNGSGCFIGSDKYAFKNIFENKAEGKVMCELKRTD